MKGIGICCFVLMFWVIGSSAQVSPDCKTAIPICSDTPVNGGTSGFGEDDFNGSEETGCLEITTTGAIESNSAWYRFRTAASGQLGFNIGFDASEDWDFALYKASDCDGLGEPIRCNFYDNRDEENFMGVGESPDGVEDTVLFEEWLEVAPGEDYYLLINNFSNSNSGFSIQFTGQIFEAHPYDALDCSIISNLLGPPVAACTNEDVILDATVDGAISYYWYQDSGDGFELIPGEEEATLQVDADAFYRVLVQLDDENIISDVQVGFSEAPVTEFVDDVELCSSEAVFDLESKDAEALGAQDPDQFMVSYHLALEDAIDGTNPISSEYDLTPGIHTIFVRTTSVDNPRCFDASREFEIRVDASPEVSLEEVVYICENLDAVRIGASEATAGYSYRWDTGATTPFIDVAREGSYELRVRNEDGGCETVYTVEVVISLTPAISEVILDDFQTENRVEIRTDIEGNFIYQLDGGPTQQSPVFNGVSPGLHQVHIIDPKGCGVSTAFITVVGYSRFFTPNGDGHNDRWLVYGLDQLVDAELIIYDRYGRQLERITANRPGWDGNFQGKPMPEADYWFRLSFVDPRKGRVEARNISNHFSLKRE